MCIRPYHVVIQSVQLQQAISFVMFVIFFLLLQSRMKVK